MNKIIEFNNKNIRTKWGKKGGEKILSLWWFFILAIIGGFIVMGVIIYYSAETNINPIESSIIVDKLADCLIINGKLNENSLNYDFDIFKECNFDKKMFGVGSSFYFNISIYNDTSLVMEFLNGTYFEPDCNIGKKISTKYFPSCTKEVYFVTYNNSEFVAHISGGVNQIGSKVSLG